MNTSQAIKEYLLILKANGRSEDTLKWYVSILGAFVKSGLGKLDVSEVTSHHIAVYFAKLRERGARYTAPTSQRPPKNGGLSEYSIQSHIRAVRAFWAWASEEYELRNPARNIKPKKLPPPPPKAVKPRDVVKLLAACDNPRDKAIVLFLMDTGARVGGLVSITNDNLDLTQRWAVVVEKGNKRRRVFFTRYTSLMLMAWLNARDSESEHIFTSLRTGKPLTTSGVYQVLKRLAAAADVTRAYNPHAFRDGFAIAFIKAGGDISTLARLLGHTDVNVTADYYAMFADEELQTLKDEINPLAQVVNLE